ncbi:MAG: WYL domain-containing protein [Candidatus Omnitrophica bacterium]|nr:WYL domain-containing protein [Candidatus Omnitrophota bacterium]
MSFLNDVTIAIVDVETTGLSPIHGDRLVEIAAMKIKGMKIVDRWESLIYPGREMTVEASMVNGITDDMLVGQPMAKDMLPSFMDFIEGAYMMGHNVKFDWKFINNELDLAGYDPIKEDVLIDTIKISRGIVPGLPSYALLALSRFFGIRQTQMHRAMSDVELTFQVFCRLMEQIDNKGYWEFENFINVFGVKKLRKQHVRHKIKVIQEASNRQEAVKVLYVGGGRKTSYRKVMPKKIVGEGKETVIVGYCYLRENERYFRLDRIVAVEPLEILF